MTSKFTELAIDCADPNGSGCYRWTRETSENENWEAGELGSQRRFGTVAP